MKKNNNFVAIAALLFLNVLLFSNCSFKKNLYFNDSSTLETSTFPKDPIVEQVIQVGDQIGIRNLQNEQLLHSSALSGGLSNNQSSGTTGYRIENDSTVFMPVIGSMKLAGLTRQAAQEKINTKYKEKLLLDPQFILVVLNTKITLLGEFTKQGNYSLEKENLTLPQIIGEAGGLTSKANKKTVKIIRGDFKNPEIIYADLTKMETLADRRLILKNNDIIYAEPRKIFQTLEKINPGLSVVGIGLSALNIYLLIRSLNK